jgi:hypothetical protein
MRPQEKAKELVNKMYSQSTSKFDAKQCALIAVDEIIDYLISNRITGFTFTIYWKEVKTEIEKL